MKRSNRQTHGKKHHPLYSRWDSMMQRCYNLNNTNYKNYGARGIKVSEEFKDINNYIKYIENLFGYEENTKLQVDRINNSKNYESGNLKLSTSKEQSHNQRVRKDNKSGYTGIVISTNLKKWRSYIFLNSKTQIVLGTFDTIEKAIDVRNKYIVDNNLPHKLQTYVNLDNIK